MKITDISYYLFESYKDAKEKFSQETTPEEVKEYLEQFKQLTKKGIVSGQEKDIGYWIKQGWTDFKKFVDSKSQEKTKSEIKRAKKKDSIIAHEDEEVMVVIPLSKDASCFYGKSTQWCTAASESDNKFIEYFYSKNITLFYIFMKDTGKKYAVAYSNKVDEFEYFDERDIRITAKDFEFKTNLTMDKLKQLYNENKNNIEKVQDINNVSEKVQKDIIATIPSKITEINNPSVELQTLAVTHDGLVLKFIDDPTEQMQSIAIRQNDKAIQYIDNPTEEIQIEAVRSGMDAIKYIDNPTENVQLEAIKLNGAAIKYIDDPTEAVKLEAVKQNGLSLRFIENPTEEMKQEAINNNPRAIEYIDNPSEEIQLKAVKQNSKAIRYIDNPTEEVQLIAIRENEFNYIFIKNPTEKVRQEAFGES